MPTASLAPAGVIRPRRGPRPKVRSKSHILGSVHVTADDLIDALRRAGLRITAPRRAICEVIAAGHDDHLTAPGILEVARHRSEAKIDQSTVYRTLEALEEAGVVAHGHLGHGASVYHLAEQASHQHIVCERCGRTAAIAEEHLVGFLTEIRERTGFDPDPTHFALSGLCPECAVTTRPSP